MRCPYCGTANRPHRITCRECELDLHENEGTTPEEWDESPDDLGKGSSTSIQMAGVQVIRERRGVR